jgi:hypothetical protein
LLGAVVGAGFAVALGACGPPPYYSSAAFFANMTHEPVSVRLFDQDAKLACDALAGRSAEMLAPEGFSAGSRYDVAPGEVLPIEYTPFDDYQSSEQTGSQGDCGAAIVQVPDLLPLKVFWSKSICSSSDQVVDATDEGFRACSVRLEGGGGLLGFAVGKELEGSLDSGMGEVSSEPARPFGWSGTVLKGTVLLERIETLPDGCLALHQAAGSTRETLYLCVPPWAFPFAADSMISVAERSTMRPGAGAGEAPARYLTLSALTGDPPIQLELTLGAAVAPPELAGDAAVIGSGYRTGCGAYALQLGLIPKGAVTAIPPGEATEFATGKSSLRVLIGRSERIVVAPTGCEPERAFLGDRLDLLTLTTPLEEP